MDTTNHCPNCEALAKEIEELRKAVAVKDEALKGLVRIASIQLRKDAPVLVKAKAALSSAPSGMRVMNTPELMFLRDTIQELRDVQNGCPLPDYQEMFDAANEQADEMLDWLSALIGGDDE